MTKHSRTTRSTRAALTLVGAGAVAASLAVGGLAQAADSSAGSHQDAQPARQLIVWLDDLLHPIDVADTLRIYGTVTSRVGSGDGTYGLSACTGETRMSDVVGDDANVFFGVFSGKDGEDGKTFTMPQHVADQATDAQAVETYDAIVDQVSACQDEPAGHWYYGPAQHIKTSVGTVTWMLAYTGAGVRDGGIAVSRAGHHLSVLEIHGAGTVEQIKSLAGNTLGRVR